MVGNTDAVVRCGCAKLEGAAVDEEHGQRKGFNATMTAQVDTPGRRGHDQIKEMKLRLHPDLGETLSVLCKDPKTTIVVLSGSERNVLDENFGELDMWLAAENGMFLRHTKGEWMITMPEYLNMDWMESVKLVFDYFKERTPRSYVEVRETSLVWNYKYADVEFGRVQARHMLQHLWTGPISNAAVDVVQGSRSVEVRSVGVSKGAAIDRILGAIVHGRNLTTPIDYVLCIGHFLSKDKDIYNFFEPELPFDKEGNGVIEGERKQPSKKGSNTKSQDTSETENDRGNAGWQDGSSVLDLKGDDYFSCAVGRKRSNARYSLASSEEVIAFLNALAKRSKSHVDKAQTKG